MKIEISKTLNISQLYDDIVAYGDFEGYSACDDINLSRSDLTPALMAKIFSALADEAIVRDAVMKNKGRV